MFFLRNTRNEIIIGGAIWLMILYISIMSICDLFGEQKTCYIHRAITENYFAGHYLFILKRFLTLCLLNCSIVWSKISRLEGSN